MLEVKKKSALLQAKNADFASIFKAFLKLDCVRFFCSQSYESLEANTIVVRIIGG